MSKTIPLNKTGPAAGRVNKSALLREILEAEKAAGRECDKKKAFLIARKRIESVPAEQRPKGDFELKDWLNAQRIGRAYYANRDTNGAATKPPAVTIQQKPEAASIAYTMADLLAAKRFLSECGQSLVKARALLDAIATLTQETTS